MALISVGICVRDAPIHHTQTTEESQHLFWQVLKFNVPGRRGASAYPTSDNYGRFGDETDSGTEAPKSLSGCVAMPTDIQSYFSQR